MINLEITDAEWKLLSDFIEAQFGLRFQTSRKEILTNRLKTRIDHLRLHSFSQYYRYLLLHPDRATEYVELSKTITNNETYFFRENQQIEILTSKILDELKPLIASHPLRILSAACSSGEEAYSLAIALHNAKLEETGYSFEIDACDINPRCIAKAKNAVYGKNSLRICDEQTIQRYFNKISEKDYALKKKYRRNVRFFEANLAAEKENLEFKSYDVIFCRNVLIYFSERAFHRALSLFARCLKPGRYLFLGHAESLIDKRKDFEPVCLEKTIIYRRSDRKT